MTTSTSPPDAIARVIAGANTAKWGAKASTARREPQMISPRARVTPAPQRSVSTPPIAAMPVAAMMPVASRKPSSASERWNVRSMLIAATANAPA